MPYTANEQLVETMKQRIYKKLEEVGLKLEDDVVTKQVWSPGELMTMFDQYRQSGQVKKTAQYLLNPVLKDCQLKRLYFTGLQTHPTAGLASAVKNGERVAKRMIEELSVKKDGYG